MTFDYISHKPWATSTLYFEYWDPGLHSVVPCKYCASRVHQETLQ